MTDLSTMPFQYTSRDFTTLRNDLIRRMRTAIPEWEFNDASFETIFIDMFCYVGDIMNFYVDRMAAEAYLQTAVMRESILNLAAMFGYVPAAQTAATGTVRFTKVTGLGDVEVLAGTQLYAQQPTGAAIIFETVDDHIIEGPWEDIVVVEGTTVYLEELGRSSGAERQTYSLFSKSVIKDSVDVFTQDGPVLTETGQPSLIEWAYVPRIIDAQANERVFTTFVDEVGYTYVRFGDGVSGSIPASGVLMLSTYRYGVGVHGNVGAGAIRSLVSGGDLAGQIASVTNSTPMTGGADPESMESMRRNIPKSLRALERAVTLEDYASLALTVGGIAKTSAAATTATSIIIAVAPTGGGYATIPLKTTVDTYVSNRAMIGTDVTIIDPTYVPINVTLAIEVNARARRAVVATNVKETIERFFEFDHVEFGQKVARAAIFRDVMGVGGVEYATVVAFNIDGAGDDGDIQLAYNQIPTVGAVAVNATGGIVPM